MFSTIFKKARATLAVAAMASALVAPAAVAHRDTGTPPEQGYVAPPPSSIAASAGDEYEALRSRGVPQATVGGPSEPSGFDWVSAAIGAAAAGGLSLLLMATVGTRLPMGRRAESA